jgi:hypothetical protein
MCTLAYWHEPRWSSGYHSSNSYFGTFWTDLYDAGADVVLNGHDHDYERFSPQRYDWQFVPVSGGTFTDSGSGTCH